MELRLNALTPLDVAGSRLKTSCRHGRDNQRDACGIHCEIP
jgi:hypothetical protein